MKRFFTILCCAMLLCSAIPCSSAFAQDLSGLKKSDIAKAEKYAKQYTVKIDQANDFLAKNNLKMAEKRLKDAKKIHAKIISPYQKTAQVTLDKERFTELEKQLVTQQQVQVVAKTIATYEKKVNEAQKYLSRRDTKNCKRFLEKAAAIYADIPESHKSAPEVTTAHATYEELIKETGAKVTVAKKAGSDASAQGSNETYGLSSKDLKKAKRYAERFAGKVSEARRFFGEKDYRVCQRPLDQAKKLYAKINPAYINHPSVVENKKEFDEMFSVANKQVADRKAAIERDNKLTMDRLNFSTDLRSLEYYINQLHKAKVGKSSLRIDQLTSFKEGFSVLDGFHQDCLGKFKDFIQNKPETKFDDLVVKEIVDLVENRVKYRNELVKATVALELNAILENLTHANTKLRENGVIHESDMASMFKSDYLGQWEVIDQCKAMYKWINIPFPDDMIAQIAAFQKKQQDALEAAKDEREFDESVFPYQTSAMERAAEKNAKQRKMELIYVGLRDDSWNVQKNGLGVPLYKIANGRGVYHVDGEDFYRGYNVRVKRVFNGSGYEPPTVAADYYIKIYKK